MKVTKHGKYYTPVIPQLDKIVEVACPECGNEIRISRHIYKSYSFFCKPTIVAIYEKKCPDCGCTFEDKEIVSYGKVNFSKFLVKRAWLLIIINFIFCIIFGILFATQDKGFYKDCLYIFMSTSLISAIGFMITL